MLREISLNGRWGFVIDPFNRGIWPNKYHERYPEGAGDLYSDFRDLLVEEVPVPGCWQLYRKEYKWYDRTAFYFKIFERPALEDGQRAWLHFGGVSFRAQVWLNGKSVGIIDCPYLPWDADITSFLETENFLVVRVEGAPTADDTIPVFGWRNFAGLLRPVAIRVTGRQRLNRILVDSELRLKEGLGRMRLRVTRTAVDAELSRANLSWTVRRGSAVWARGEAMLRARSTSWSGFTPWRHVDLWEPGHPNLYRLTLELRSQAGDLLDREERQIGFRQFRIRGRRFFINGKRVWLRGINRHHLRPRTGMIFSRQALRSDFDLIQELGCNAVRLPHMPNDETVLDECDRRGLLTWVEVPAFWNADFARPEVRRRLVSQVEGMVVRDYCHPAVVIWSVANEVASDRPETLRAISQAVRRLRRYDNERPVTFASLGFEPDKNLAMQVVDICSLNRYRGWYTPDVKKLVDELRAYARVMHKPIVLSETGAGAVAGKHGPPNERWTEEYQARVMEEILHIAYRHAQGCFIWLLADFEDPSRVHSRIARGFVNNKGLVSEDLKHRKMAFEVVKRLFEKIANAERAPRWSRTSPRPAG